MNAQDDKQDTLQSTAYNPFPEPQTIPAGWDLSALTSKLEDHLLAKEDHEAKANPVKGTQGNT